jgi:hypothetical protein
MTTLIVLVVVAGAIAVASYFTNAGFGDRAGKKLGEQPSGRDIEALLAPLLTPATSIEAARDGHAAKISGRVEAVAEPWGEREMAQGWSARVTPSDAGGTRARIYIGDGSGRALVEIPFGRVELFARAVAGWEILSGTPVIAEGTIVSVFGVCKRRAQGYRDNEPLLVVRAANVSGEPPPSK